jgi:hypothetical protein
MLFAVLAMLAIQGCSGSRDETHARQVADRVRTEFLHAWNNYERYAWGHDALRPLSKTAHDWYGQSLLMTPVDALDTLVLMHLDAEAAKTRLLIVNELSFDRDVYVKNFEVTIRLLGGLLSSYQLTGDKRLLNLAEDLGTRLLPVFDSPTGLPYVYVNLRSREVRVIAGGYHLRPEIVESTYYLYRCTGDPQYRRMGEKIFNDFVKYCRTDAGYAALADVTTKQQRDEMESFVLAETFKYFYLLFAPPRTLDFDRIVFNTEAHPLRRTW